MTTFVQAAAANATSVLTGAVTQGNLLVVGFCDPGAVNLLGFSDTMGNVWNILNYYLPDPTNQLRHPMVGWAIAKANGATTITASENTPASSPGIDFCEYSNHPGSISGVVIQDTFANWQGVSCGPISAPLGVIMFNTTLQQGGVYTSQTGMTTRQSGATGRLFMGDNLGVSNTRYYETGSFGGTMASSGATVLLRFGGPVALSAIVSAARRSATKINGNTPVTTLPPYLFFSIAPGKRRRDFSAIFQVVGTVTALTSSLQISLDGGATFVDYVIAANFLSAANTIRTIPLIAGAQYRINISALTGSQDFWVVTN